MLRKILLGSLYAYLALGFVIGLFLYKKDLNTYECIAPNEPHGYITKYRPIGGNPDPKKCKSHGTRLKSLVKIPAATILGPPVIIASILRKPAERRLFTEQESDN